MGIVIAFPAPAARGAPPRATRTAARPTATRPVARQFPVAGILSLWLGRIRQRRALRRLATSLPETALRDVGLNRARLLHEGGKPFWVA